MKHTAFKCFLAVSLSILKRWRARNVPRPVMRSTLRIGISAVVKSFHNSIVSSFFTLCH